MNGRYLLDTNAVIALWSNDPGLESLLSTASLVSVPCIALGELYSGARKSARAQANLGKIDEFVEQTPILGCDAATAKHYGQVRELLRRRGRPIPDNDVWIAALAQQYDLVLVSRDEHFMGVEGLQVVKW